MLRFKENVKNNIRIFLLFPWLLVLLSACVKNEPVEEKMGATYRVTRVTGSAGAEVYESANNGLPSARQFHFKTCFVNIKTNEPIIDHQFVVYDEQRRISDEVSDAEGCITWTDQIKYNALAQSPKYKELMIYFAAEGIHRGRVARELAVFPFDKAASSEWPDVVDMYFDKSQIPDGKLETEEDKNNKEFRLAKAPETADLSGQLFLDELRVRVSLSDSVINHDGDNKVAGFEFDLELSGEPYVYVKSPEGHWTKRALRDAAFEITPYLIHIYKDDEGVEKKVQINLRHSAETARMIGTTLTHEFQSPLQVPFEPTKGNLELAFKIVPSVKGVKPLEAAYPWGSHSELIGQRSIRVKSSFAQSLRVGKRRSLGQYVESLEGPSIAAGSDNEAFSYRLTRPSVSFSAINKEQCDASMQREVKYDVFVCIENPVDSEPLAFTDIQVSRLDGKTGSHVKVDTEPTLWDGCLVWEDKIRFNYYESQHYFVRKYQLQTKGAKFNEKVHVAINPWTRFGKLFGRDAQQLSELPTEEQKGAGRPKIVLHSFSADFERQSYTIDDKLGLKTSRKYLYQFRPRVLRNDSVTQGSSAVESLKQGMYIARLVLTENPNNGENGRDLLVMHEDGKASLDECWAQHKSQKEVNNDDNMSAYCRKKLFESTGEREIKTEDLKYISHYEVPVWVQDGVASVNVEHTLVDLHHMDSRNLLFVEILPVQSEGLRFHDGTCEVNRRSSRFVPDEDSPLQSVTYMGYNPVVQHKLSGAMVPVAVSTKDLIPADYPRKSMAQRERDKQYEDATLNNFVDREGLILSDLGEKSVVESVIDQLNFQVQRIYSLRRTVKQTLSAVIGFEMPDPFPSRVEELPEKKAKAMDFYQFSEKDLRNIIRDGDIFKRKDEPKVSNFAHAMCGFWFDDFYRSYLKNVVELKKVDAREASQMQDGVPYVNPVPDILRWEEGDSSVADLQKALMADVLFRMQHPYVSCLENPFKFFWFEKLVHVNEVESRSELDPKYVGGSGQNYIVNTNFVFDEMKSKGRYWGWSWDLNPGVLGSVHVGREGGKRQDEMRSVGRQINLTKGAYLVVARTDFRVKLKRYRHCLSVKPKRSAIGSFQEQMKTEVKNSEGLQKVFARAGFLMCLEEMDSADASSESLTIEESYFYIFQHFASNSAIMDDDSRHNRPLMFMLRGENEFSRFVDLTRHQVNPLKAKQGQVWVEPDEYDEPPKGLLATEVDPVDGMVRTAEAFGGPNYGERELIASYPGVYFDYDASDEVYSYAKGTQNERDLLDNFGDMVLDWLSD